MSLHKRCIDIRPHAFHRAVERFRLTKARATAVIRRVLRQGTWYENPEDAWDFLVIGKHANRPVCVIARIEEGSAVVTTIFPMRNTSRVRAYQQHTGGVSASEIAERFGLGRR